MQQTWLEDGSQQDQVVEAPAAMENQFKMAQVAASQLQTPQGQPISKEEQKSSLIDDNRDVHQFDDSLTQEQQALQSRGPVPSSATEEAALRVDDTTKGSAGELI